MLTKQAEKGALLKPEGKCSRCQGPLYQFGKIKSKSLNLRIIYRPSLNKDSIVEMGIIAIGPRDNTEVYRMAIERLNNPSS